MSKSRGVDSKFERRESPVLKELEGDVPACVCIFAELGNARVVSDFLHPSLWILNASIAPALSATSSE